MLKKSNIAVLIFFALMFFGAVFSFWYFKNSKINTKTAPSAEVIKGVGKNIIPNQDANHLFVAGWLPYWKKNEGAASLAGRIKLFNEINLFAFGVDDDGNLVDTAKVAYAPWPALRGQASKENVEVIPTILWTDASAMHKTFANQQLLNHHVDAIAKMLEQQNFSGIDIDYEGKDIADRDNFTAFLEALHSKLSPLGKNVSCTVEARSEDSPPVGWSGTKAMSWANDFSALNNFCDSVRIMAYDEVFQNHRANTFEDPSETPSAPNADKQWVEKNMRYALNYISPEKLILGIPTYGWEFKLTKLAQGYRYTRVKSVSYLQAIQEAQAAGVESARNEGGELSFAYKGADGEHLVNFSDAEAVRQKIVLAQNLALKGVSLFKLDGLSDPQLFPMLEKISAK